MQIVYLTLHKRDLKKNNVLCICIRQITLSQTKNVRKKTFERKLLNFKIIQL